MAQVKCFHLSFVRNDVGKRQKEEEERNSLEVYRIVLWRTTLSELSSILSFLSFQTNEQSWFLVIQNQSLIQTKVQNLINFTNS